MKAGWLGRDFTVKFYSGRVCWGTSQASSELMDRVDGEKKTPDINYVQFHTDTCTCIVLYCLVILPLSDTWLMHIYYQVSR